LYFAHFVTSQIKVTKTVFFANIKQQTWRQVFIDPIDDVLTLQICWLRRETRLLHSPKIFQKADGVRKMNSRAFHGAEVKI
jgi:hypothetical protein